MKRPVPVESASALIDAKIKERGDSRAIDIHEGDTVGEAALNDLFRAAAALNRKGERKAKPRR